MTITSRGWVLTAGGLLTVWMAASGGSLLAQQPATGAAPAVAPGQRQAGPPPAPPTGAPFDAAKVPAGLAAPKMWTAQQDRQDMMTLLGIKALRPGPSGTETAPNHANYDEATANPYPNLPDVLTLKNGKKVTKASMWADRRKEIIEEFDREVLGRVPKAVPKVTWTVTRTSEATVGGHAVVGRVLTGHADNSAYPAIDVDIQMTLVTPKDAKGAVPVMMMFGGGRGLPGDPPPPGVGGRAGGPGFAPPAGADPPSTEQLIADGWGYASINPSSIQADNGAGLTRGIVGLVNKGQQRKPDDWGSLRAWAWGASRGLDYLETEKTVDAKKVGIEGVSRYGKAALVTMAYDTRFAVVLIGSSGEGGAKLHRRNWGEAVENLTGSGEYHWMAGNFLKYGASDATFGSKNAGDIPVDAHELIALCAPRLTFVSYGVPEKGDAKWLDHQGSFMAAIAAQPVFRLLGAKDLGRTDDYKIEKMPAVNVSLLNGQLAWRQHDGGHTDGPNWKYFIPWADTLLKHTPAPQTAPVMQTAPAAQTAPPVQGAPAVQGPPGGRGGFAPVVIGPSAPVPAEVAMLRPAATELAQINDALKKFIDADKSAAKPLMKKYESLLMVQPPRLNTAATFTQTTQRMGPRHVGFVETAKAGNIDLLLHGDSITDWWVQNDDNRAVFNKYFGTMKTANFAISGDTTQGVLWGLHNGEGQGFQPKAIMLMIGTNNTLANTAPEIAEGVGAVIVEMRKDFPDAKILMLAIFPRSVPADPVRDKIAEVNRAIAKLDDNRHVFYFDIGSKFLDERGVFLPDAFRTDNLHPQAKGYEIWGQAVKDKLAALMK